MPKLSPAAEAVLNASTSVFWRPPIDVPALQKKSVAAALRAAADQLITVDWSVEMEELHDSFHAIANELEAQ
jgi:hypothetical protein